MTAMGTELNSARRTFAVCEKKEVEVRANTYILWGLAVAQLHCSTAVTIGAQAQVADADLPRIRDVSAWQRLLKAKLDAHDELEMSRKSRSRVVTKIFTPDQQIAAVAAQFHEKVRTTLVLPCDE